MFEDIKKKRSRKEKSAESLPADNIIRRSAFFTVGIDVLLVLVMTLFLLSFISRNDKETFQQNVDNITDIAVVESGLMRTTMDSIRSDVDSAFRYCQDKPLEEILDYLSLICDPEEDEYQLLRINEVDSYDHYPVYDGFSTRQKDGEYLTVSYNGSALAEFIYASNTLADGSVRFSQNFTNSTDALRYFAAFCPIDVDVDGESVQYYLVKPCKENRLLDSLQVFSQYDELNLAICYTDGKYLAADSSFRAGNFFDYLYRYNNLTMDQRNAIRDEVRFDEDGAGALHYMDYRSRDCVFSYAICEGTDDWAVVVSVPESEFVAPKLLSFFPITIISFLAALLVFNVWNLLHMVKRMRQSARREKIANSAKSSFLSRMSHEIRTPLNAIIGYISIAITEMTNGGGEMVVKDLLQKSELASKHLLSIINDVLDMSAIESGKMKIAHERFDFKALVNALTTIFYSQSGVKGVDLEVRFDTLTEEWFVGDQMRISQVLTNLLSNAVKFTPEGGRVTLRIRQSDSEDPGKMCFVVEDTGIGMTQEYLTHIWDPFEQADSSISRRFGGTGLGLSITKTLVELMGGTISAESRLGEGSKFTVELSLERTEQPKPTPEQDFSAVNALVVDDDENTRNYISLLFERCKARCATAASGAEALEMAVKAVAEKEPYTLFIIDWKMPDMDGIDTAERLKEVAGEAPMMVLTAYDYTPVADKARELGVNRFVSKPLFQSSLFDLLSDVCGINEHTNAKSKSKGYDFNGARVLLAEDNKMNMEIARRILSSANLVVECAWNGAEAVDMFSRSKEGAYSAILMDVHMPAMDGYEATRTIRAGEHPQAKSIPIIAMTADVFAEDVAEAHASGMNDHIGKPIDIPVLFSTLNRYIK